MGCNCKTNRDLAYLRKYYGDAKRDLDASEEIGFGVNELIYRFLTFLAVIICLPFLLVFIIFKMFSGKTINIGKLLGLKYVGKQQNIQD